MTQGQKWLVGGCLGSAGLILTLTLTLSLTSEGTDPRMVLRHAAFNLVTILVVVAAGTITYAAIMRAKPTVVYADKESLRSLASSAARVPGPPQYDTRGEIRVLHQKVNGVAEAVTTIQRDLTAATENVTDLETVRGLKNIERKLSGGEPAGQ